MTPPRIVPYCTIPGLFHDATAGSEDGELHIYAPSGTVPVDGLPVLAFIHVDALKKAPPPTSTARRWHARGLWW